jgi:hypothetical protein
LENAAASTDIVEVDSITVVRVYATREGALVRQQLCKMGPVAQMLEGSHAIIHILVHAAAFTAIAATVPTFVPQDTGELQYSGAMKTYADNFSYSGACDPDIGGPSVTGECGPLFQGNKTCTNTQFGACCSQNGYCGNGEDYCFGSNCYSGACTS